MSEPLSAFTHLTAEERHEVEQFLLPSTEEIVGILSPGWVEPRSLRAKGLIRQLLGLDATEQTP